MNKKRIGVIGCGQWGPNQIRTFFFHPNAEVVRVCDSDPKRLEAMKAVYRTVETTERYEDVTAATDIDAVVITTPVSSHHQIAVSALENGKDLLCEKPLTRTAAEARQLVKLAEDRKRILMVGHVFLYNPGIMKLKEVVESGELGQAYYLHAQRTNLGPVRKDVNSVFDLASHDISIFNFLLGAKPKVIGAVGRGYLQPQVEDVAFVSLEYPGGVLAHIHVSWLDPKKVRQITVVGSKKMATWDDLAQKGPVEIFAKRIEREGFYKDYGEFHLLAKDGEVLIPSIKNEEPLKRQAEHFIHCIVNRTRPISDGQNGLDVVETLEAVQSSLIKDGGDDGPRSVPKPYFHPRSLVESRKVGRGTRVWAFAHVMRGAVIGRDCNVGDHAFIESGVAIGDRVTVKNGVSIWQGVTIGDDVFIGPNAAFTNDRFPVSRQTDFRLEPTRIGRGAAVGANATVVCGVTIGAYAMIGAGAVVTRNVPDRALVYGNPAKVRAYLCDCRKKLKVVSGRARCGCGRSFKRTAGGMSLV